MPKKQIKVKDWHLESCGTDRGGLELQNINVVNSQKDEILVLGKVNVKTFLSAPVTVRIGEFL
jgi:ribosomal protein L18E